MRSRAGKYLSFRLGKDDFAIQVLNVCEIMGMQEIVPAAPSPQTSAYVKGVINLRGKVIPVIDLRLRLGMEDVEPTQRTCIIMAQVQTGAGHRLIGTIVDGVFEVLTLEANDITDADRSAGGVEAPYVLGLAKIKGRVKTLLDVNLLITQQDLDTAG